MVRTFLCHPYTDPKAFTDQYDPVTFCYTSDDRIIISSVSETVYIHNLQHNGCPRLHKFASLGVAVKMLHSDNKKFLVTIETRLNEYKKNALPIDLNCQVRLYVNYSNVNTLKSHHVLNGYTSTLNAPNSSSSYLNYLNKFIIIDINVKHPIVDISLCPVKDNLALASKRKIYIYGYKEIAFDTDNDTVRLVDFERLIELAPSFQLHHVDIFSNWLSFASKRDIHVVQLFVSQPEDENIYQAEDVTEFLNLTEDSEETPTKSIKENYVVNDSIGLDDHFVVWNFTPSNAEHTQTLSKCGLNENDNIINFDTIKAEAPYIDSKTLAKEITGPVEAINGHPIRCSFSHSYATTNSISCTTLLFRRFDPNDLSISGKVELLHSLQFLPIFVEGLSQTSEDTQTKVWPWNIFQLPKLPSLASLGLFFSSGRQGFLYDISGTLQEVCTYNYTSDCFGATHSRSLLYTYTSNGLEIYTSRLYSMASNHWKENSRNVGLEVKDYKSIPSLEQYHKKMLSDAELFTEMNYFGSYVTISKEEADDQSGSKSNNEYESSSLTSLTVYSPKILKEPCPPLDIEVCLIGMYPLQHISLIGSSTSFIISLVKAIKREKQGSSYITPWSVYVLEKTHTEDFYAELMKLVEGNEFSNPTIYYQILCEAHVMLRSEIVSGLTEKEEANELLKSSAVKIADFLARVDDIFNWKLLPYYYEMASMSFTDVLERFIESDVPKERKFVFGNGMIEYLKHHIFSPAKTDVINKEQSEFILKVFFKNQPSLLANVLLQSKVLSFEDETAIKFVNKWKRKQESKNVIIPSLDCLCLAYLNMKLGNPANAEDLLKSLSESALLKICVEYKVLIFTESYMITPFGQLIKKHLHQVFLLLLVSLFDLGEIQVEQILDCYKKIDEEGNESYSYKVCEVLETLLLDNRKKKHFSKVAMVLVGQYVDRLTQGMSPDSWKSNHSHLPKASGHFADRYSWLNKIHPFQGDFPTPQDCILQKMNKYQNKQMNRFKSSNSNEMIASSYPNKTSFFTLTNSPHAASSPTSKDLDEKMKERTYCPCCCCSEILIKFQSLLCSRYNRKDFSTHVINKLSDVSFVGKDPLLLLCWPKAGFAKDAVEFILGKYPSLTLQYAKDMFDWKAQWQLLLQHILSILETSNYEQWNQSEYLLCLKGVLMRLSRAYTPLEFLSFLPSNGNLQFFLPFIHECWEYNQANVIKQQFLHTYGKKEEVES